MAIESRIGIIGGNGWIGSALAKATVGNGLVGPEQLILSGRSEPASVEPAGAHWARDNAELAENAGVVVLSVRPEHFSDVRIDATGKLVVSVMAGVTVRQIAARTGAGAVVRALPNAAATIGRSFTPWFAAESVTDADKRLVQSLFDACGTGAEVAQESHIDYCVAMTGSGAAFPALLAEALIANAIKHGLPRNFAERAARSVLADATRLFADDAVSIGEIVGTMINYGGTTAAALQTMLDHGFNETVAAGLEAALERAAELGN